MTSSEPSVGLDHFEPAIDDGNGYRVRLRDLEFLNISEQEIHEWRGRRAPLGMSALQYDAFRRGLCEALAADGVAPGGCDVRLKGSSADFFSGYHKLMPKGRDEIIDLFRELRGRIPEVWEIQEIQRRLTSVWIDDGVYPSRRPFDSMHRLGVARAPSDYDIQLSSDAVVTRCDAILHDLGQSATGLRVRHPVYDFVRKDLVEYALPRLFLFVLRMADALGRHVSVAVFASSGPSDASASAGLLSAHFRRTDWLVDLPHSFTGSD